MICSRKTRRRTVICGVAVVSGALLTILVQTLGHRVPELVSGQYHYPHRPLQLRKSLAGASFPLPGTTDRLTNLSGRSSSISGPQSRTLDRLPNTSDQLSAQYHGRQVKEAKRHVFFLKVHKAASTTVMNLLYRFALRNQLVVMLPKEGNILSECSNNWRQAAVPLPQGVPSFDIVSNHLVFNEQLIRDSLYPDVPFIGIVREPLLQFISAFYYNRETYAKRYLKRIPGLDPLKTYFQYPALWEPRDFGESFTHNRMSFDFGMDTEGLRGDKNDIERYIVYLNNTFDLVMVSERFDESMVLLRRLLGWKLQDVLYLKSNVFHSKTSSSIIHHSANSLAQKEKLLHRDFNVADYALYDHFSRLFQKKIEAEGAGFDDELATYRSVRQLVAQFCENTQTNAATVPATEWNERFQVLRSDCDLMAIDEKALVGIKRREQLHEHHMISLALSATAVFFCLSCFVCLTVWWFNDWKHRQLSTSVSEHS